jgi:hypothetical protein
MRQLIVFFALIGGCADGGTPADVASDFQLPTLQGGTVRGSELWKESPVLLVFMSSW